MEKSEFQCKLSIYFENEFDVNEITRATGILPHISLRYSESGYTKSNVKQPGSWQYYVPSEYRTGWSIREVLEEFLEPFSRINKEELGRLIQSNNGLVSLDINIFFKHENLPEICFEGEVMKIIHALNANINININEEVEESGQI